MHQNLTKTYFITAAVAAVTVLLAAAGFVLLARHAYAQAPPAATPAGSSFEQRVAQRKAERNVVLAERDQKRMVSVCVSAQSKIRILQQETTPAIANRAKVNREIDAKLWIMIGKLKLAEKDTFELEKQRAGLAGKVSGFQQTADSYSQALDDTVAINCRADLIGFKALLDTARIYRTQLRDQSTDIRSYVNNDIKATLGAFADELQIKPSTEEGR